MRKALFALAMLCAAAVSAPAQQAATDHWYDHAVIYEIYPRSFQDTNGDGVGDLKGVTQRLDYLHDLGVDAIWLTPFFPSPNFDFGYDISDYTNVSPEYGTMADWDQLVAEARKRNIRVLVDFVVNHTSDQHPWFKESRSSRTNPKRDWYIWRDGGPNGAPPTQWQSIFGGYAWTKDAATDQWFYHIFMPQQPDVNWMNPGLRKAMFDVARFWLDHGASGFRLDATPYLVEDPLFPEDPNPKAGPPVGLKPYSANRPENHEILRQLRSVLNGYPGQPVLLGESLTQTIEDLRLVYGEHQDEIQLPMDFLIGDMRKLDAAAFKKQVDAAELKLDGQPAVLFFSSHDHQRQWTVFGDGSHNDQIARLTATLTLMSGGATLLYYGEELGMANMSKEELAKVPLGPKRPRADERDGNRTPMQWTGGPQAGFTTGTPWLPVEATRGTYNVQAEKARPDSIYNWYAALLKLRKTPAFRTGQYLPLESGNDKVFAFARKAADGKTSLVVLNTSESTEAVHIAGEGVSWSNRATVQMASPKAVAPQGAEFRIAPFGVLIVQP